MSNKPKEWNLNSISDVTTLITKGSTPTTYGHDFVSSGIKFYRGVNASSDGRAKLSDLKYITVEANELLKRSVLEENDFIISIVGAPGETSFVVTRALLPGNINQNVAIVRSDVDKLDPVFIKNWFQADYFKNQKDIEVTTQAQPSLSLGQIGGFKVILPPLQEQKKIAEILTSVDKVIEFTDIEIEKLKNLKKGMMQDLLTKGIGHTKFKDSPIGKIPESWEVRSLQDFVPTNKPITYGVLKPGSYIQNGTPLIQIKNIISGKLSFENIHRITDELHNEYKRTILEGKEILISLVGTIGRVAIIDNRFKGANIHRNLGRIFVEDENTRKYIHFFLQSTIAQAKILNDSQGSSQSALNLDTLRKLKVPFPGSNDELIRINNIFTKLFKNFEMKVAKLEKLKDLKKGLMQDLLTGKVRVKV